MAKEFYVVCAGRVIYAPGYYEEGVAQQVASGEARSHPGRTYHVMQKIDSYRTEKPKKDRK